jgi:hypothetical protein
MQNLENFAVNTAGAVTTVAWVCRVRTAFRWVVRRGRPGVLPLGLATAATRVASP